MFLNLYREEKGKRVFMFNSVSLLKNQTKIHEKNQNKPQKVAFSARCGVVPMDIKKGLKHGKKVNKQLGEIRAYLGRFLDKGKADVLKSLGIENVQIHPHFIERTFTRTQSGKIPKQGQILNVLQESEVYKQPDFNGVILRGADGLNLILAKITNKKWQLQSLYPSDKPFTTWKKAN